MTDMTSNSNSDPRFYGGYADIGQVSPQHMSLLRLLAIEGDEEALKAVAAWERWKAIKHPGQHKQRRFLRRAFYRAAQNALIGYEANKPNGEMTDKELICYFAHSKNTDRLPWPHPGWMRDRGSDKSMNFEHVSIERAYFGSLLKRLENLGITDPPEPNEMITSIVDRARKACQNLLDLDLQN